MLDSEVYQTVLTIVVSPFFFTMHTIVVIIMMNIIFNVFVIKLIAVALCAGEAVTKLQSEVAVLKQSILTKEEQISMLKSQLEKASSQSTHVDEELQKVQKVPLVIC